MSTAHLTCKTLVDGEVTRVLCPSIGRVMLSVQQGSVVSSGQTIGVLWRLNREFCLLLPDDVHGSVISIKGDSRIVPLAYGEAFMELKQQEATSALTAKDAHPLTSSSYSVDAPMDGMFYLSSSPHDPPYVKIGDTITPGQTIGLIEVMKSFFPLKFQGAKQATVVAIKVKSATPVSLGTRLFEVS